MLHQRDEHRYFDGVMGDKHNKGELFGFKNLLSFDPEIAGAEGGSNTRALLGRKSSTHDGGEERFYYIEKDKRDTRASQEAGKKGEEGEEDEGHDQFGIGATIAPELSAVGAPDGAAGAASQNDVEMLRASGMVHMHINDRVLGGGELPAPLPDPKMDDEEEDGDKGCHASETKPKVVKSAAPPRLRPAAGGGLEASIEDDNPEGGRAQQEKLVQHGRDGEVPQIIRDCATFDEMMFNLQEDPHFAAAVLRCVQSENGHKLADAVNALPRMPARESVHADNAT